MKVILLDSIENVGKVGDVIDVAEGYARNFLFPRQKAMAYTKDAMNIIEKRKKLEAVRHEQDVAAAKELSDKLAKLSCTVKAQAGEEDVLYGSVTALDIQNSLELEGISIDKKKIIIEEPIKKLGIYPVKVKLLPEVETVLKVWVVRT